MADRLKNKRAQLCFNLTMIGEILGCDVKQLKKALPKVLIDKYLLHRHKAYYYDNEVFEMLKSIKNLATDAEIIKMIYPKGII